MPASLANQIADDIKTAMRARDTARLSTLRLLHAAIQQKEVDERRSLNNDDIMAIIERQIKQRRESIAAYEQAGRSEIVQKEQAEVAVLQEFLPEQASQDEIIAVVDQAIEEAQAQGLSGGAAMGRVMAAVKKSLAGRVDMGQVSALVKERLQ